MKLKLTKSQWDILDRAREVLSATGRVPSDEEVILRAAEDLLEKRDPLRKAQRAAQRAAQKGPASWAASGADATPEAAVVPKGTRDHEITTAVPKPTAGSGEATSVPKCAGETPSCEPQIENLGADKPADVNQPTAAGLAGDHEHSTSVPKCVGGISNPASALQGCDFADDPTAVPKSADECLNGEPHGFAGAPTSVPKSAGECRNAGPHANGVADSGTQKGGKPGRGAKGRRPKGRRGIPADHIRCVAFGQDNRLENLRLLCAEHTKAEAQRLLGERVMERYRWLTSRGGGAASGG